MGCSSCGTATGGKPGGCKSNGGCSTGGCNRMNTYDWLHNLPMVDTESACKVIEVSFNKGTRKDFYRNPNLYQFEKGEMISVEGVSGFDVGEVSLTGEIVRLQMKKRNVREENPEMKKVLRTATDRDVDLMHQNKAREPEAVIRSRAIAKQLKLDMKISQVEMQADGRKATFFYIADGRVDFRELIKVYASEFKVKVEMRQIGARQEAGKVGGIGSCGRELCCSTWLTDFKSVNTAAARYQNLSINQTKLSGQCGRLKCCLNYELDTYLDALQHFPDNCDQLRVAKGNAYLIKKDIFKNLMWYTLPDSTKQYPLSIERVTKIKQLNGQGIVPDELEPVELAPKSNEDVEPEFVDLVGQISLRTLEKADRKKRQERQGNQRGGQGGDRSQGGGRDRRGGGGPEARRGGEARGPREGGEARGPREGGEGRGPREGGEGRGPREGGGRDRSRGQREGGQPGQPRQPRTDLPPRTSTQGDSHGHHGQGGPASVDGRTDTPGMNTGPADRPTQEGGGQEQRQGRGRNRGRDRGPREDRPQGERPSGERPQGERPQGERPQGERPQGEQAPGDRSRGDKNQARGPREGGGNREGGGRDRNRGPREGGPREGGPRAGGPREGGPREGSNRESGQRQGGNREGGNREGGNGETGNREGGNREGGNPGGGNPGGGNPGGAPPAGNPIA